MSFEQPLHTIEEKAAEAMAVLGFEALYQADDESTYPSFEEHSNEYRDEIATTSNSTASDFDLNVLFGTSTDEHDITELTLDSGRGRERNSNAEKDASQAEVDVSKGIVAWFHQKRVEKSKPPKMAIIMATEEVTALTPKRKASFSTTDTGSTISSKAPDYTPHLYYHPSSPKKRRSVGNKMRVWLRKRSSAKDHVKTLQADLSPQHVPENEPMPPPRTPPEATQTEGGNTHRLTITLRRRRQVIDEEDSACCLCMDEFLDLGYFCQCLGEGFKEEGLKLSGIMQDRDDENSVVENNFTLSQDEEERSVYSV